MRFSRCDRPPRSSRLMLLALLALSAGLLLGCSAGTYPFDYFSEMHYQQSYKKQEPPSLSAPAGSVPTTGREVDYTLEQARALQIPFPAIQATIGKGTELYQVNCAVCHGASGKGDGPMRQAFRDGEYRGIPSNLTVAPTTSKPDGEVFQIITKGFANMYGMPEEDFVMPPFRKLLTVEERWMLVHYIRSIQQ